MSAAQQRNEGERAEAKVEVRQLGDEGGLVFGGLFGKLSGGDEVAGLSV